MVFSLKLQTLRLVRVHVFVCHTYMFNVGTQWYVIVYSVKCKGLQTRPSYIFLCYIIYVYSQKSLIWIIRTISLIRTAYKTSLPKCVRITGVGLYNQTVPNNHTARPRVVKSTTKYTLWYVCEGCSAFY